MNKRRMKLLNYLAGKSGLMTSVVRWPKSLSLTLSLSLSDSFYTTVNHFISTANDNPTKPPKEIQQEKDRHEMFMKAVGATSAALKPRTNLFDEVPTVGQSEVMTTKHSSSNGSLSSIGKDSSSRGVSSNAYANGSHQNVGNMITDRPTSKVTQPPGGKSTIGLLG